MMSQRIFNINIIAKDINSLSSLASTFYKNETIVEQQFAYIMFTDCMVVHFIPCHSVFQQNRKIAKNIHEN